jgi:hypothetical protein
MAVLASAGLARRTVELGLAHYRTELVGNGVHQYLVLDGYDHRRICAAQLIRDGKRWYALTVGEADGIITATPSDFATGPSVEADRTAQWPRPELRRRGTK